MATALGGAGRRTAVAREWAGKWIRPEEEDGCWPGSPRSDWCPRWLGRAEARGGGGLAGKRGERVLCGGSLTLWTEPGGRLGGICNPEGRMVCGELTLKGKGGGGIASEGSLALGSAL